MIQPFQNQIFAILLLLTFSVSLSNANENAFEGSGGESGGTNSLMVYPSATSSMLEYRLGDKRHFRIRYADNIDASTFVAIMNGKDISKHFHPSPGTEESVYLRLKPGANVLGIDVYDKGNEVAGLYPNVDRDEFDIELKGPVTKAQLLLTAPPGFEDIDDFPPRADNNGNRPVNIDRSKR